VDLPAPHHPRPPDRRLPRACSRDARLQHRQHPGRRRSGSTYLEERGLRNVTIVAHSKGGLIGKYALDHLNSRHRLERLIAIAAPFSGSPYARWFINRAVRDFAPTTAIIRELQSATTHNHRITSIYGTFDPHIPGRSALAGATNLELPVKGHFRLLADPLVIQAVLANLPRR
jgi:pimeloyl-ACP methyl ester carboxylesterase